MSAGFSSVGNTKAKNKRRSYNTGPEQPVKKKVAEKQLEFMKGVCSTSSVPLGSAGRAPGELNSPSETAQPAKANA